jgi:hypothetical protein
MRMTQKSDGKARLELKPTFVLISLSTLWEESMTGEVPAGVLGMPVGITTYHILVSKLRPHINHAMAS